MFLNVRNDRIHLHLQYFISTEKAWNYSIYINVRYRFTSTIVDADAFLRFQYDYLTTWLSYQYVNMFSLLLMNNWFIY